MSGLTLPPSAEASERLVCAVLAAQVEALRDQIDNGASVDLLWQATDLLSRLSGLLLDLTHRHSAADPGLHEQCVAAVEAEAEITRALDALAFAQTQRQDCARQMAECVTQALVILATTEAPMGSRLSPHDLAALYVSENQRTVHELATRQFELRAS